MSLKGIEYSEDTEPIYKNDRIKEINKTTTMNNHGKVSVSYDFQIVQEFDKYENPTVIYGYNDTSRVEIKFVNLKNTSIISIVLLAGYSTYY